MICEECVMYRSIQIELIIFMLHTTIHYLAVYT